MENFNFGWAALGLTILFHLLPIVSIINYIGKKTNFENIPIYRIITSYVNCLIWHFYGWLLFNDIIKYAYTAGGIISLFLIIIYLLNELKKYFIDTILNCIILIIGTLCTFEWFGHIILDKYIVGKVCVATSIIVTLTECSDVYVSIKERNYLCIRVNYSIISFPAQFCWIIFGFIIRNYYIIISNLIGIISNVIQIIVYIYIKKEYPIINVINEENIEGSTIDIDNESKKEPKEKPVEILNLK